MPISSVDIQRAKEGNFYFKKSSEEAPKQLEKLDQGGLRISTNQALTKTALAVCLLFSVVGSVDATKRVSSKLPPSLKKTSIKTDFPDNKIPSLKGLIVASKNGDLRAVRAIIKAGFNVNQENEYGEVALKYASQNGHTKIVKALVKAGANVNARDKNGATSLHIASEKGYLETVEALIEKGADVKQKNEYEEIALKYASQNGHIEVVKALIKAGANVNANNKNRATSLHVAAENGHLEIVKVLIEAGANIKKQNRQGRDALSWAKQKGHTEIVKFLTEKKRLIDEEAREIKICPVDNRYDRLPLEQKPKTDDVSNIAVTGLAKLEGPGVLLPQQIQQSVQPEELSTQQNAQPDNVLALTATSLVMLGGAVVLLLQQPVVQYLNEEEMILKASHLLDPINLYLDKLPFFSLEEIKPLEWKIEDNKFVLELEHQPEDLKREIQELFNRNFGENIESITQENENKSIIKFNPAFTAMVKNSNEIILQDLNFIALQYIKDQLELLCARKNQEFEEKYGEFFMGLDFIEQNKVILIGQKHFIDAEDSNFKELMHFNLLNNFGLLILDDSLKNQLVLSISENGKISYHDDFYAKQNLEDDDPEIVKKFNKRTEESEFEGLRDSIHNGVRIGERLFDRTDPIAGENKIKFFVRFPEKPSDFALACKTTNRRIEFFEAETNNQFEIQALRPINREDAVILFNRIRIAGQGQAPAPVIQNGAQLNQPQGQNQQ
jgi:ankyrin repeat protein